MDIGLRKYQIQAIQLWENNGYRGIWSMATGTGKTLTALMAISRKIAINGVGVIVVPGKDLVDQWATVIRHYGFSKNIVKCYSENNRWRKFAAKSLLQNHLLPDERRVPYLITTAATAISPDFQKIIEVIPNNQILLVGDEVHRLGAEAWQKVFSIPANLGRLGLSATPSRQWDEEGTAAINDYFGGKIFEYNLQDALRDGWLCQYSYHIKLVGMTIEERSEYMEFSDKIRLALLALAKKYGLQKVDIQKILKLQRAEGNNQLELLLFERANIVKGAAGKLEILNDLAKDRNLKSCMVYCNDESQVSSVLRILNSEGRTSVGFTSTRLASLDRKKILSDFENGVYDFIVAIKCLDEGIDIPNTKNALIMASSKTEREWIQRRGRLLRKSTGKQKATIYDCVVVPARVDKDGNVLDNISSVEVNITYGELQRANEFAQSAINASEALISIENIKRETNRVKVN